MYLKRVKQQNSCEVRGHFVDLGAEVLHFVQDVYEKVSQEIISPIPRGILALLAYGLRSSWHPHTFISPLWLLMHYSAFSYASI